MTVLNFKNKYLPLTTAIKLSPKRSDLEKENNVS